MKRTVHQQLACILFIAAALLAPFGMLATEVKATAATGGLSVSGSGTWSRWNVTPLTTIAWSSGTNVADRTTFCATPCPMGTESKFDFTPPVINPPGFGGRNAFTGFTRSDVGPLGSTADTSGSGSSLISTCWGGVSVCGEATWDVKATGTIAPSTGINWVSRAEGKDPWSFSAADFAVLGGPAFDLYIPLEVDSATIGPDGSGSLIVSLQTASGILSILDVEMSALGVSASGLATASFYAIGSVLTGPLQLGAPVALSQIFQTGMNLNNPTAVWIVLHGLPIPVGTLADGSAAHLNIDTVANDQAAAPEPATFALAGATLIALSFLKRR